MNELERRMIGSIPGLPPVARKILEAGDTEAPEALAEAIGSDPALEARLLRLIHSPLHGLSRQIVSVGESVRYLGPGAIRDITLGFCVLTALRSLDLSPEVVESLWRTSLLNALAARRLAQESGQWDADEAFLCGLVADCGTLLLRAEVPEYRSILAKFLDGRGELLQLERDQLPTDHMRVGKLLLESWGFPETLCTLVGSHHEPAGVVAHPEMDLRVRILSAAWLCARALTAPGFAPETLLLDRKVAAVLGLGLAAARAITSELPDDLRVAAEIFGIPAADQRGICELLERPEQVPSRFELPEGHPGAERTDAGYDRILFSDLRKELVSELSADDGRTLLSREAFETILDAFHGRARQARSSLGLMILELRGLDAPSADERTPVLEEIRSRIEQQMRTSDVCASFGGDRIAVLVAGCERCDLEQIAERLRKTLERAICAGSTELCCAVTIGVAATAPHTDGLDARALVRLAEAALGRAQGSPARILVEG
jgi:diguanylate cyclase (GGDEF)-like protein